MPVKNFLVTVMSLVKSNVVSQDSLVPSVHYKAYFLLSSPFPSLFPVLWFECKTTLISLWISFTETILKTPLWLQRLHWLCLLDCLIGIKVWLHHYIVGLNNQSSPVIDEGTGSTWGLRITAVCTEASSHTWYIWSHPAICFSPELKGNRKTSCHHKELKHSENNMPIKLPSDLCIVPEGNYINCFTEQ